MNNAQYKSDALDLVVKLQHENSALLTQVNHVKQLLGMVCEKLECDLQGLPGALDKINNEDTTNAAAAKKNTKTR